MAFYEQKKTIPIHTQKTKIILVGGARSDVCTKYQEAAKIVNLALSGLVEQCKPGAKVLDLCEFGHNVIHTAAQKLFTKKNQNGTVIERGVAFPVCISVNDCVCNYSPLLQEERVRYFLFCFFCEKTKNLCGVCVCVCLLLLPIWCLFPRVWCWWCVCVRSECGKNDGCNTFFFFWRNTNLHFFSELGRVTWSPS